MGRKILWVLPAVMAFCMVFLAGCGKGEPEGYVGVGYDLFDPEQQGELTHISIQEKGDGIAVEFIWKGEAYHMEYVGEGQDPYEYFYQREGKEFYAALFRADSDYSGLVRDLSDPVSRETQFGFVITLSASRLEEYLEQVKGAFGEGDLTQ